MPLTAAELRDYGDLPAEVLDPKLDMHLGFAEADLIHDAGVDTPPAGADSAWQEAQLAKAMSLLLPKLHLFTLNGAAAAVRTAEASEAYFLSPEEVEAAVTKYEGRYTQMLGRIAQAIRNANAANGTSDDTGLHIDGGYIASV